MLSRQLKYSFLPLLLLFFLLAPQTAEACSCAPKPTVMDSFNYSDVVIIASVVSVEKASKEESAPPGQMSDGTNYVDGIKSTTMRVDQVFKGKLKIGDEMIFGQGGGADCVWTFEENDIGQKYLFYLGQSEKPTLWYAGTCGRSRPVQYAADDLLYLNNLNKVRNKSRISGTLRFYYATSESFAGRKIRITGPKGTHELKTDDNGVYEIYDLPAGRYIVEPEVPKGWKLEQFMMRSRSVDPAWKKGALNGVPIILEANKHAGLDFIFQVDNVVRGHIYDPLGQPMKDVCLDLIPADGSKGSYLADCTEADGAFEIDEIPPGDYVIIVNDDGEMTSTEPFGAFFFPKARKRDEATVFNIGLGEKIENLEIYPAIELKTITVEGVLTFSDGKPFAGESVVFKSERKQPKAKDKDDEEEVDDEDSNDARTQTDRMGKFSIKIVQGAKGTLFGSMYTYAGEFENCPKLDRLIKQGNDDVPEIKTPPFEIRATTNLYGVELKFSFPSCKKAKSRIE